LTQPVIGPTIEVHRSTGLGLLKSSYEQCLCVKLRRAGIAVHRF